MMGTVRTKSGAAESSPKGFRKSTILTDKNLKLLRREIRKGFKLAGRGKMISRMKF